MDIAVFSDIHGNYIAFQKCLNRALQAGVKEFIFLGDYLGEFPYPQRTMKLLYEMQEKYHCTFIRGNKEDYWLDGKLNGEQWKAGSSSTGTLAYTYSHLTPKDLTFFQAMPIQMVLEYEGMESLQLCHGSPEHNKDALHENDEKTNEIIKKCGADYILCGHTHIQTAFTVENKKVWNAGAVGVALQSNGKAQFMILHSKDRGWNPEFVSLEYEKERVIKEFEDSGLLEAAPYWSRTTIHLIQEGAPSHETMLRKAAGYCMQENGTCKWNDIPEKYWKMAVDEML